MSQEDHPVVVWCITDGKAGHENQVKGLVEALADKVRLDVHFLEPLSKLRATVCWLRGIFHPGDDLPEPALVIGAGHSTHMSLLAARRAHGGKSVVLMKPSLPCRFFDLCVIPEHDNVPESGNVIVTRGVLNRIRPTADKDPYAGLILVGGPSKHYRWDDHTLIVQIRELIAETRIHWTIATSRRTPASFLKILNANRYDHVTVVPAEETDENWLPRQLERVFRVWVTEDSVSMVYEALGSGARCGLLQVPMKKGSRIRRGIECLLEGHDMVSFNTWEETGRLGEPLTGPSEAQRVAELIVKKWPIEN